MSLHNARYLCAALLIASLPVYGTAVIQNGSFESIGTQTASYSIGLDAALPGWTVAPAPTGNKELDCLIVGNTTANICGTKADGGGQTFWQFPGPSPDGGNYVAVDGSAAYENPLQQVVAGLVVGKQYVISFYQAAAQQSGFTGANTEQWEVSFGTAAELSKNPFPYGTAPTQTSALMTNASEGDVGWMYQALTFTAVATTQTLQFYALGTPTGQPPFVLLDGVNITQIPEPDTIALIGLGLIGIPALRKLYKKRA